MNGNRIVTRCLVAAMLFGAFAGQRHAFAESELEAKVATHAQAAIDEEGVVGLVIAVVRDDETFIRGFGKTVAGGDRAPDERTVFEIGSITKAFTGILLATMVEAGEVRLDTPLQELLPESVTAPKFEGREITLVDLATHSAALPRLPANFLVRLLTDDEQAALNPYAKFSEKDLYESVSKMKLKRAPGAEYTYSNLGMGLLGHVLAKSRQTTYIQLISERILSPLEMADTTIEGSDEWRSRMAQGHDADAKPVPYWDLPVIEGAGALRSTAADMLKFVRAQLEPDKTSLGPAIRLAQRTHFTSKSARISLGLAWHIGPKEVIWHNGGTGGFHSFVGFEPDCRCGVVVLSNSAHGAVDGLGFRVLELMAEGVSSNELEERQ